MSRQSWTEAINWSVTTGTAVVNTTTETILFPTSAIPANYMQDGRLLRLRAFGSYSDTGTPTLIFGIRIGGVTGTLLCKTAAITLPSGVTNAMWDLEAFLQTASNGATGTIMANGICRVHSAVAPTVGTTTGAAAVTPMTAGGVITPASVVSNLIIDNALALTITWSAASASNTILGLNYLLESMN